MAAPTVTGFSVSTLPAFPAGGTFTITGTGLDTVTAVLLNDSPATFTAVNATTINVTAAPSAAPGNATVKVTNPDGTAQKATGLTITDPAIPTRNNFSTHTGVFDTSGTTRFVDNIAGQYRGQDSNLWAVGNTSYAAYLAKVAKIKAVQLEKQRRPLTNLPTPTF